jgi:hypothetical protein
MKQALNSCYENPSTLASCILWFISLITQSQDAILLCRGKNNVDPKCKDLSSANSGDRDSA